MNQHDFIFSDRFSWRLKRHTSFWLVWWVYNLLTQFFPGYWFPGWQVRGHTALIEKIGWGRFIEFSLIENFIGGLSNQLLFVYVILYFLLPAYFYKAKWAAFVIGLLVLLFITQVYVYYIQQWHYSALLTAFKLPQVNGQLANSLAHKISRALATLPVVAALAVSIRLLKRWWLQQQETEMVAREKMKAELQLLKAKVHPHFLFNSLNNIYSFSLEASSQTPGMIQKLSGLLHYMVYECEKPYVLLSKELNMIRDYISLESVRYGKRLAMHVTITEDANYNLIAPLLLIPFVENSFKHGSSQMLSHPEIKLDIRVSEGELLLKLVNSKPVETPPSAHANNYGLGLANVKKRLALLYPHRHKLEITELPGTYTVSMRILLANPVRGTTKSFFKKQNNAHEYA